MEYQFDYATFCKTFNVKDDKAIDSLRLTHTQDINFKLFPYKASGKTQAPIITELEEVVSDFFRKSLKLESEPVQYESLCDNIITEMDIEDEDIEIFKEMIHSLFFEGDNFVAKNLGLYPYQTKVNNKSVDRLAGFLIDVLGLNGNDCNIIEQAMKNYPYNVVEKLVVDAIQTSKIGSTNNNKSYFPVVIGVQEKFKNDFYFMLNTGMTSLDDLSNLLAVYYFYYMSQACVTLDNFGSGKRNSPVQLYYALDWEKVSKNRKCCVEGWERIQSSANHMFSHAVTLEILNQHKFSGVMLDYISREKWLEELLEIQKDINENGPEEFANLELITIPELRCIRRIWVFDKHEFEDSLPGIYKKVTGKKFDDPEWVGSEAFRKEEWDILEEVVNEAVNDLYSGEEMLFEMVYSLIDIENQATSLNKRKGITESLENCIRKTFYKNEEDATQYYMDRVIRKKDLGGKYNSLALDGRYDYLNEENEDEDEDAIE